MNFNTGNFVMLAIGGILIMSAVTDKTPKGLITDAFNKSNAGKPAPAASKSGTKASKPSASGGGDPPPAATIRPRVVSN